MAAELRVEVRSLADGRDLAVFAGEVDATNVTMFRRSLAAATNSGRGVADLSELTYLDSAGVEVLFEVARAAELEVVSGPDSRVRRLLDVVSLASAATLLDEPPN